MSITLGTAALLGGGSVLSGILGGVGNYLSSGQAVKKQIDWERERATHAHQWEVQDLQAAGLNPILSAGGSGAVTGGISAPQPDLSPIANAIPNAMSAIQAYANAENSQSQTRLNDATTGLVAEQTATQHQKTITEMAQQKLISNQTAKALSEMNLNEMEIKKLQQNLILERKEFDYRIEKLQIEIEQAKANKNYQEVKTLETEQDKVRKEKENRIYYADKALGHVYNFWGRANETAGVVVKALRGK